MTKSGSRRALELLAEYGALQASERFQYVTIHPLADEPQLLARLGMRASECIIVDCYWALGDGVAFVSVDASPEGEVLASYRPGKSRVSHFFFVRTRRSPLTSPTYEQILERLEAWFLREHSSVREGTVILSREDLAREE